MSVSEDSRVSVDARVTLTLRVGPPRIIGVAVCLPIRVPGKQAVLFGKMVVNPRVVLIVDSSGGHLSDEVVRRCPAA